MARLFGLGAVLLGAAASPAMTQDAPPRTVRLRSAIVPTPTPTPVERPNSGRIARLPATETPTPTPGPSSVYIRERGEEATPSPEPSEERPVRGRRPRGDGAGERTSRDSEEPDAPPRMPVRERRGSSEETPPTRDYTPVRVRRSPAGDEPGSDESTPSQTTPVRTRRIPIEATPPPRDTGPAYVRRTPVVDRADDDAPPPSDITPVRVRRTPLEAMPVREPTPVRVRPYVTPTPMPTEVHPVRPVRPPVSGGYSNFEPARPPIARGRCGSAGQQPGVASFNAGALNTSIASIVPPPDAAVSTLPDSLTLRAGSHADVMRTLPTLRQIPMSVLQGNSTLTIGKMRVDFKPMIMNPKALVNIAQRLRAIPDQVEICADVLEAMEIKQGLVVRSLMTYRILPGACRNEERRARLANTGVACFTRRSTATRESAFANPRDAHYVADPARRATAISAARLQANSLSADIDNSVAEFRGRSADPAQRAEIAAEIGDSELARLDALDDGALAGELANAAETKVEQVAFIPNADDAPRTFPQFGVPISAIRPPPPRVDVEYDIGSYVFLTGFTLGKQYEWKQRVETTIKWCFVGCKRSYYAELFAGFAYDFGLRFPIRFGGTYNPSSDEPGMGRLTVRMAPINGGIADYQASGLPDDKLFNGAELVARASVHAGASAKLPIVGVLGPVDFPFAKDLTDDLPSPLTGGQFTPPTPGVASTEPEIVHVFDNIDLLGGRANFGVLGGKLLPSVKVKLSSEMMSLTLTDTTSRVPTTLYHDGDQVNLAVNPSDGASTFSVSDPSYKLDFTVTPGVTARLFIDLAVWGNNWDWPIWFPQLAVTLPPGGVTFSCHEGTVCSRSFRFNTHGAQSEFEGALEKWAREFAPRWEPKCLDEPCKLGIRFIRQGVLFSGRHKFYDNPNITIAAMKAEFAAAEVTAQAVVTESLARKAQAASNAWGVIAQAIWTKQCKDKLCYDKVTALASEMGDRARQIAKANPSQSSLWVTQQVNKEYVPRFKQAIDDSTLRDATEQSFEVQRQLKKQKMPKVG
jgi:hypothetical protein